MNTISTARPLRVSSTSGATTDAPKISDAASDCVSSRKVPWKIKLQMIAPNVAMNPPHKNTPPSSRRGSFS